MKKLFYRLYLKYKDMPHRKHIKSIKERARQLLFAIVRCMTGDIRI